MSESLSPLDADAVRVAVDAALAAITSAGDLDALKAVRLAHRGQGRLEVLQHVVGRGDRGEQAHVPSMPTTRGRSPAPHPTWPAGTAGRHQGSQGRARGRSGSKSGVDPEGPRFRTARPAPMLETPSHTR